MKDLQEFLNSKKLLIIATVGEDGNPWTCNVYYSADSKSNLFFVSPTNTKHIQHLEHNSRVSFSIPWYDENDLTNRKAIQGTGTCKQLRSPSKIISSLKNHSKYFPLWKDVITYDNMRNKTIKSRPFVIEPDHMKFWNDELYGSEGTKEFNFK